MNNTFRKFMLGLLVILAVTFIHPTPALAGWLDKINEATNKMQKYSEQSGQGQPGTQTYSGGGSLSAALGATKLDGLDKFAKCQSEMKGYREKLIADRVERKLGVTGNLTPAERNKWMAEITALRQVQQTRAEYIPPDPKDPQHYFLGLTDQEQVAINSMNNRFIKEIQIKCEHSFGGMSQFSNPNGQQGSAMQDQYVNQLRGEMMQQQVLSIDSIPVEPLPSDVQVSPEQKEKERMAKYRAMQDAAAAKFSQCTGNAKGLRPKIIAQVLQRKLDTGAGLSAKDREQLQADIQAAYLAAGKGLDQIAPDPKNSIPLETRLSPQDQIEISNQYNQQYMQVIQSCGPAIPGMRG